MIFLDSGNIKEIKRFNRMKIISGVTTNPTILLKDGIKSDNIDRAIFDMAVEMDPLPLSVEVLSVEKEKMIEEAKHYANLCNNINIKIPIHSNTGESFLDIIARLEYGFNIRVNATAMMNAQQMLLAGLNSTYISLFAGRVNDMGINAIDELKKIRNIVDRFNLKSKIICGSVREPLNVIEWLQFADIVTVPPDILDKLVVHPRTKETVSQFERDAKCLINTQ